MNLDNFIENKYPSFRQGVNYDHGFSLQYYFSNEVKSEFTLIPKTTDISIHDTILQYLNNIKSYSPPNYYVATTKDITVTALNDVGSIYVKNNQDLIFSDVSTRYKFDNFEYKKDHYISGQNVLLSLDSGSNYFHWVCQILPRIKLLNEFNIDWGKVNKILIPEVRGSFVFETLQKLNVPTEKLLEQKRGSNYNFENLYIPCKPNNHIHLSKWSIDFLKKLTIEKSTASLKKLFISRKKTSKRYIENEKDVYKLLKKFGFEKVFLDDMSFESQASLFSNATHIVATHGASLANLVFCKPSTKVIELYNPYHFHCLYWSLSNSLNLDYYYLINSSNDKVHDKSSSLMVDLSKLKNIISHASQ